MKNFQLDIVYCFFLVMLLTGCGSCGEEQISTQYPENRVPEQCPENQGPFDCRAVIYVPRYGENDRRPSVDVYWDGQQLYSGTLPVGNTEIDSMIWLLLIRIRTNPGTHVLKVVSEGRSDQYEFELDNTGIRALMLSSFSDGRGFFIEDLGYNVKFR